MITTAMDGATKSPNLKEIKLKISLLVESCEKIFQTTNIYEVLGVTKEASKQEVKKGYYKNSLAYHPDRVSGTVKIAATNKFQVLSQVYGILSDDGHRTVYDETVKKGYYKNSQPYNPDQASVTDKEAATYSFQVPSPIVSFFSNDWHTEENKKTVKTGYYKNSQPYNPDQTSVTDKGAATYSFQVPSPIVSFFSNDWHTAENKKTVKKGSYPKFLAYHYDRISGTDKEAGSCFHRGIRETIILHRDMEWE